MAGWRVTFLPNDLPIGTVSTVLSTCSVSATDDGAANCGRKKPIPGMRPPLALTGWFRKNLLFHPTQPSRDPIKATTRPTSNQQLSIPSALIHLYLTSTL